MYNKCTYACIYTEVKHSLIAMFVQPSLQWLVLYTYAYYLTLTDGMAKISDAADVNALACRRSDTRPATTPPVYIES